MVFRFLTILSLPLLGQFTLVYSDERPVTMHVHIGTLSEILIPEPYTIIQSAVQIVEMRDVAGRNKRVVTVHPVVAEKTRTNLRIYTRNYDFNIDLLINWPGSTPTTSLDLSALVPAKEEDKSEPSGDGSNQHIIDGVETDAPVTRQDFNLRELLRFYPRLLKSDRHAPAILQNKVVFAMDHVFHYKGKLVFKATLWNKSKVPYNIRQMTITYKEEVGLPIINQREVKSFTLTPFYEIYSRKLVPPGKKAHIIYITAKLSPQDRGFFNCMLAELKGTRNFDFNIPAIIK
jgi:hypothetical protein